jgi:hypothetical protein
MRWNAEASLGFSGRTSSRNRPVSRKQPQKARLSARARQFRILGQRIRFQIDAGTLVPEGVAAEKINEQVEERPGPGRHRS